MRRLYVHDALKILAWKTGKYAQMCHAFATVKAEGGYRYARPDLKFKFESEMMPLLEEICGSRLGENPNYPDHPIRLWKEGA